MWRKNITQNSKNMNTTQQILILIFGGMTVVSASLLLGALLGWLLRPKAPAIRIGWQEDGRGGGMWLYTLTEDVRGHCRYSTVCEKTLKNLGYRLP